MNSYYDIWSDTTVAEHNTDVALILERLIYTPGRRTQ